MILTTMNIILTALGNVDLTEIGIYALSMLPLIGMAGISDPTKPTVDPPLDPPKVPPVETPKDTVTMSQDALDGLIKTRTGEIRSKMEQQYADQITKLNDEITGLKKVPAKPSGDDDLDAKIKSGVEAATSEYQTKISELETTLGKEQEKAVKARAERLQEAARSTVSDVLASLKVHNPHEVFGMLSYNKLIGFDDDGKLQPQTPEGNPVIGDGGKPKALDVFLKEYIDARPYLVTASKNQGSGAQGGAGGGGSDDKTITSDDPNLFQKALAVAQVIEQKTGKLWHGGAKPNWDKENM